MKWEWLWLKYPFCLSHETAGSKWNAAVFSWWRIDQASGSDEVIHMAFVENEKEDFDYQMKLFILVWADFRMSVNVEYTEQFNAFVIYIIWLCNLLCVIQTRLVFGAIYG